MANLKHTILQNEPWLKEELKTKSVMRVAKEVSAQLAAQGIRVSAQVLHGCITYRKNRWPKEDQDSVVRDRSPNKTRQRQVES